MNCQRFRFQVIDELLEGRTTLSTELAAHLDSCAECRTFYQEESDLNTLLQDEALQLNPSARIWTGIESALSREEAVRSDWNWERMFDWFRLPAARGAVATLALLVVVSIGLMKLERPGMDPGLLAQVDAFHLEVEGNPFAPVRESENPFLDLDSKTAGNPFEVKRSLK